MSNRKDAENSAREHRDSLKEWLDDAKKVVTLTPKIQQAYEIAEHQYDLILTMPEDVDQTIQDDLLTNASGSYGYWQANLPKIESASTSITASGLAMSVYDSTSAYDHLTYLAIKGTEKERAWAQPRVSKYREIQTQQHRIEDVHYNLGIIKTLLAEEFISASDAYRAALSNVTEFQNAGIQLRNVLAHTKGELIARAMFLSKKQRLKWYQMASILAKGGNSSPEHTLLITQDAQFKSLHDRLTIVAKNQSVISNQDLVDMFTDFLDFLFTVLNLVDLEKF